MMENKKVGIGIVHCQSGQNAMTAGYNLRWKSDNGHWLSMIEDTGEVFNYIKINDNHLIIRMIHLTKDGWYMCSMKPALSRGGEYRASWVYFPACIILTKEEIRDIINVAESQIERTDFDETKLQNVISLYNNYDKKCPSYIIPSSQSGFAFRDVSNSNGGRNLFDLYDCIYQNDFAKYEWVILMEKSDAISLKNGITDISKNKIYSSIVIKPESVNDTFGFTPYLKGNKFEKAIRIQEGDSLSIEYKKNGYQDIPKTVQKQSDLKISVDDCFKVIKKSWFVVLDSNNNKQIHNATIELEGGKDNGSSWIVSEKNLANAKFIVKSKGYITKTFPINLTSIDSSRNVTFKLDPECHEYLFTIKANIPFEGSKQIEIVIKSQFEITGSPFDGYICQDKPKEGGYRNDLFYNESHKNQPKIGQTNSCGGSGPIQREGQMIHIGGKVGSQGGDICKRSKNISFWKLIVFVIGVIILISALFIGGVKLWQRFNNHNNRYVVDPINLVSDDQQQTDYISWNAALKYLKTDTNSINKDEMDKYGKLEGLYDILNNYKFEDLKSFIDNSELKDSILDIPVWKRIYEHVSGDKKPISGHFCKDRTITLKEYENKAFQDNQNKEKTPPKSTTNKTEPRIDGEKGDDSKKSNSQDSYK